MADPEVQKLLDKAKELKAMSERLIEQGRELKKQSDKLIEKSNELLSRKPILP